MKLAITLSRTENGDYLARCPSLPGCTSRGCTREEAQEKLREAIQGYMASVSNFPAAEPVLVEA